MLLCFQLGFSQTKLIAHKRHSGNNFAYALKHNSSDVANSNFGVAPMREVKNAQLDSVIYLNEEKAIMVTSYHCVSIFDESKSSVWEAGRDTVYNHPLFSHQHNLDSIKHVLKTQYHFQNDMDSVVFVGYSNDALKNKPSKVKKKKNILPFIKVSDDNHSNGNRNYPSFWYVFSIAVSFMLSLLYYFFKTKRMVHA